MIKVKLARCVFGTIIYQQNSSFCKMVHIAPISDTIELQYCIILVKMVPYTGTLSWVE